MTELIAAILGAALAWWAGEHKERKERRRRRYAYATALLGELKYITNGLRKMSEDDDLGGVIFDTPAPVHDEFIQHADLFESDVIEAVLQFSRMLHAARDIFDAHVADSDARRANRDEVGRDALSTILECAEDERLALARLEELRTGVAAAQSAVALPAAAPKLGS